MLCSPGETIEQIAAFENNTTEKLQELLLTAF